MSASVPERVVAKVLLGLVLGGLACGDPVEPRPRMLREEFEVRCGELPCGWDQVAGPSGGARYVTTVLDADHGLSLAGAGVVVRGPGGEPGVPALTFGALEARLSARCDPGNTLELQVAIVTETDSGTAGADSMRGAGTPPWVWSGAEIRIQLVADSALLPGSPFAGGSGLPMRITGVTIGKSGSGTCEIDRLIIDDVGFLETADPSC